MVKFVGKDYYININDKNIYSYRTDIEKYRNDIPVVEIVKKYVHLYPEGPNGFIGTICIENQETTVSVNTKKNFCKINDELIYPDDFIELIEGAGCKTYEIIKNLTGVSIDDYANEVIYNNGDIIYKNLY